MSNIMCCYISSSGRECEKEAEYKLVYGNSPDDVTESCSSHIGHLVDDRIERFEVIRISGGIMEGDTIKVCAALQGAPDEIYKVIRSSKSGELILDDVMGTALSELKPEVVQKVEECEICHGVGATTDHHDPCTECGGSGYYE